VRAIRAIISALALPGLLAAAPNFRASATHLWADNISRTSNPPEQRDATALEINAAATFNRQLSRDWFAWAGAEAATFADFDFSETNHSRLGLRAGLRRKFGLGPQAPTLDLEAALSHRAARYVGDCGLVADASARFSKRVTETLRLGATGEWHQQYARHSTFDVRHTQLSVDAAWDATDRWQFTAGAGRLWGDVVANASGPTYKRALEGDFGPIVQAYYAAIAYETGHLYGRNWISYRVHSRGDSWWLGAAYSLGDDTTLAARLWTIKVVNRVGIRYDTEFWSLMLAHRF
jgi:hypothetical protein